MKEISSFLNKFQGLIDKKFALELCCEDVFKSLNLPIQKKDFEVVGGVLKLKRPTPILKSEVSLKKDFILNEIERRLKKKVIFNIS